MLAVLLVALGPAASEAGTIYNINFDGATIDLSGFIDFGGALGNFSPTAFDAAVLDYSITASVNGASSFVFTAANSSWGGGPYGGNVTIGVGASDILLSAPTGGDFNPGNLFLIFDGIVNGCCTPNLRIFGTSLGYRTPNNVPADVVFNDVDRSFTLATAVPEPSILGLLAVGTVTRLLRRKARRARR